MNPDKKLSGNAKTGRLMIGSAALLIAITLVLIFTVFGSDGKGVPGTAETGVSTPTPAGGSATNQNTTDARDKLIGITLPMKELTRWSCDTDYLKPALENIGYPVDRARRAVDVGI